MKISLNWLKEYIDLSDITVDEIVSKLTMSGLEVESVENQIEMFKNFIVGFVEDKEKHPNADKLSLCVITNGIEKLKVVCGAPNVAVGQKVVFAQIGAVIPTSGMKISKAKIRGIESNGMLCSESELGLSDDHSGIIVLDQSSKEGTSVSEALHLNDVLFEIGVTPNRADALSHIGVARDLAAIFQRELKLPKVSIPQSTKNINELASIEIVDVQNCPRYSVKVVLNVEIKESPDWLKRSLKAIGLRPINNIVDVTNFVLHEIGQPLHAFDLDKLAKQKIIVKKADADSLFTTLDGKERKLNENVLLICDGEKPAAVAGVMGGENSEVTSTTKNILIESAYFNPSNIRKTSKYLGLSTDASYRFERGTDPSNTVYAAERAAQLMTQLSGGEVVEGVIDIYPNHIFEKEISLRFNQVERVLGYTLPNESIKNILTSLGFEIKNISVAAITVLTPTFRPDVEREIDLIEEIARINSYDAIPTIAKIAIPIGEKVDESAFVDDLRNIAMGLGFNEILSIPMITEKAANIFGKPIGLLNPQGSEMGFLRTSLLASALSVVEKNINVGEKNLKLFEIGKVFLKVNDDLFTFSDFIEEERFLFLLSGKISEKEWYTGERDFDFYDLKAAVNECFQKKVLDNLLNDSYYQSGNKFFDYFFTKASGKTVFGTGGKVKKEVLKQFGIQQDVFCFEGSVELLKSITPKEKVFTGLLRFPKVMKDFGFIFGKDIPVKNVVSFIKKKGSSILKDVHPFDVFENESIGASNKSVAFSLSYFDAERTLTDEEVDKDFLSLIELVKKEFNAVLRGK
ncbi:MAG: phenylalanine--tRNA ligase subunit beta [Ignavibacteria bacterium CG22_combo_CG10-13_8_21_14_all_37_15]|nr:MAG: phenylalanine--tRNA ligase subunit beta [Ignavibacteria bacterium CG22_combo_CG10-13_8_21_14_all_37_15]PJC60679.1 MAG: phenylalanine--tRNA ligase subunit beta [Ignavibacteria bacterium CG_4_9_14_0_2_um_filter_37_13]